jgi:hypothetical protein
MLPRLPTPPALFDAPWLHQPFVHLALASLCLLIALRYLRRAIAPVGVLVRAAAAAAVAAFATGLALALVAAVALGVH